METKLLIGLAAVTVLGLLWLRTPDSPKPPEPSIVDKTSKAVDTFAGYSRDAVVKATDTATGIFNTVKDGVESVACFATGDYFDFCTPSSQIPVTSQGTCGANMSCY
jgi:hypothetical protein